LPSLRKFALEGSARLSLGPHPDRASRDAESLLLTVIDKDRSWLMAHGEDELHGEQVRQYVELLERRKQGEPMQYITGDAEFYGFLFHVTPAVLIPRPETEHLVEAVIHLAASYPSPRIIDVGTGSGCIAVSLAHELPKAVIAAIDLSTEALAVARRNAELNEVSDRIRFLHGDLLAPVAGERFELIVSNPPYVPTGDRQTLAVEVREHEPALALFAGEDGLDVYRRLIPDAYAALVPGGLLALEIGYGQSGPIASLLCGAGFERIEFIPDLQSIDRVACARRPRDH
jgi:release factor glutamine methyltransferase